MKKIFLTFMAIGAVVSASAQSYVITGKAPNGAKTVYLGNMEAARQQAPDSTAVAADGTFTFKGEAAGKIFAFVSTKDENSYIPVVLDGNVTVDFATQTASGTAENAGLHKWLPTYEECRDSINNLIKGYNEMRRSGATITDSMEAYVESKYGEFNDKLIAHVKACCDENLTAKFPAYYLRSVAAYMEKEDIIAYADKDAAFLQVGMMERVRKSIDGWRRQVVGAPLTDIEMADTTGTMRKLSEFVGHGKYVLVDFWASWCGPCRQEMPHVKAAYDKYHAKGFDIVGLSFDNKREAWTGAIKKLELPWHHLSDLKGWQSIAAETYGINSIPATLLFGPDGKVIASGLRGEALSEKLADIFK